MGIDYKMFVINSLFGLMEGSASSLERMMKENFMIHFGDIGQEITVELIPSEYDNMFNNVYIVTLKIGEEEFKIGRDFGEEYEFDSNHPDHKNDLWFYESEKCHSYKTHSKLKKEICQKK